MKSCPRDLCLFQTSSPHLHHFHALFWYHGEQLHHSAPLKIRTCHWHSPKSAFPSFYFPQNKNIGIPSLVEPVKDKMLLKACPLTPWLLLKTIFSQSCKWGTWNLSLQKMGVVKKIYFYTFVCSRCREWIRAVTLSGSHKLQLSFANDPRGADVNIWQLCCGMMLEFTQDSISRMTSS